MGELRAIVATLVEMACTRVELGTTELAEARWRIAQQALAAVIALFFLGLGLVLGVFALAWWAGPDRAAIVLGTAALIALLVAAAAIARWRGVQQDATPLLQDTLAQLRADARALEGYRS
jgi:uncharacterized membrane protein YqjE